MVTLLKKDINKGHVIDNFRLITLLNADLKILAKVLAKQLVLVIVKLVNKAQTCAVLGQHQ